MGDRANVFIPRYGTKVQDNQGVYLYTHWDGYNLPITVQKALKRQARWDDAPYLARMIFGEMVGNDTGETGYGIDSRIGDNEHKLVVVDCENQRICFARVGWDEQNGRCVKEQSLSWVPFSEYIKMNEEVIREMYGA